MTSMSRMLIGLLTVIPILFQTIALPATARTEVDVELVLAVDVSRSMSPRELEIQRRGYAEALQSDEVIGAILDGLLGRVALAYVEWSETGLQRIVVDWTVISDRQGARAFAAKLTANFDEILRRTSISGAIDFASAMIESNEFDAFRRIIDVSGDGPNNEGAPVLAARARALAKGIVINGLPLMTREGMGSQWHLEDLDLYYRDCVIGGPGAFVIPVRDWTKFPAAVRQKLVQELSSRPPRILPAAWRPAADGGYDCLIGEKMWQRFIRERFEP